MNELNQNVLKEAQAQVCALLAEEWENIVSARNEAAIEASRQLKEKFNYSVTLKVIQEPKGHEVNVQSKISYAVPHANETDTKTVDDQPRLNFGEDDTEDDTEADV